MTDTTLLKNVDLFRAVDDAKLDRLGDACLQRTLSRGDELFVEGDQSNELFVVESGLIAIANQSFDGRESVVALMEPGDIFGEMPLFDGKGRSAAARALEPSVVLLVPYQPVRDLYDEDPTQLWSAVDMLTRRLRSMDGALADSVFLDVTGRTANRLLEMAGDEDEFALPVTQEELAGMVGASRERVNKAIASFVKLGWLEQNERRYNILDRNQMQIRSR